MKIVINADDYGLNKSISVAIDEAMHKGVITDTTLCINGSWCVQALKLARMGGYLDHVGLHINLTEGRPLTEAMRQCELFCTGGIFHGKLPVRKKLSKNEQEIAYKEICQQISEARKYFEPSHVDSHHHVHMQNNLMHVFSKAFKDCNIKKVRNYRNIKKIYSMSNKIKDIIKKNKFYYYFGDMVYSYYFGSLDEFVDYNFETDNVHIAEIMVHPQYDRNGMLIDRTIYDKEQLANELVGEVLKGVAGHEITQINML
jgi:hypothetical protein